MKIGIFTHYYKSSNYGGNLQAYALCSFISKMGYSVEQISYDRSDDRPLISQGRRFSFAKKCARFVLDFLRVRSKRRLIKKIKTRDQRILEFNSEIPHSPVKTKADLKGVGAKYDCFITGSDQVWAPGAVCDGYLLNFDAKYKMSYAASFSVKSLSEGYKGYYQECISKLDAISVREDRAIDLVRNLAGRDATRVLDPTLLLSADEWGGVKSDCLIPEKYVFCFFLGNLAFAPNIIKEYSKARGLKIVSMPYLTGLKEKGAAFGDYKLFDVSPNDFLSLIDNAECVFTDSFHASVFSHIFHKDFFVFNRSGSTTMNDRIYSLVSLFDTQDRFCDSPEKMTLQYMQSLPSIDYSRPFPKFNAMKEVSIRFLKDNLEKAEKKCK